MRNQSDVANRAFGEHDSNPGLLMQMVHIFWRILTNIATHRKVIRLLRLWPFSAIAQINPKFGYKYLATKYLARGLTVAERGSCFAHHYARLYDLISDRALHQILYWDFEFRTVFEEGSRLALSIGTSRPFDNEGELSLLLKMDGEIFFTLSFTIVPGWIVKSKATEVLLISRLQGVPGYSPEQTRLAIKTMHEVRPRALLLSALEGVAIALGIQEIVSVSAGKHIDYCEDLDTIFRNSYDAFFSELGLVSSDEGFFTLTVPIEEKPLSLIKQGHKIRTRKKRAFRKQVQMACSDGILKMTGRAKEASAMNNENVPPEINEFDVKYVITRTVAVGQAKLPHPASRYLADEKSFG